jgi:prepilin-type N-terminal cleavage/methylation domain-containing protein
VKAMPGTSTTGKLTKRCPPAAPLCRCPRAGTGLREQRQEGYTLFELLVVSALIATVLAVTMPALTPNGFGDPLKSAARRTIALVNEVRAEARLARQPLILHVDPVAGRLWFAILEKTETDEEPKKSERVVELPPAVRIVGLQLGEEDLLELAEAEVWVSGRGYLEELQIRLEDDAGQSITLDFSPFHEAVTVSDRLLIEEG